MKNPAKIILFALFTLLIGVNLYIFVSSMNLSQQISYYEDQTNSLQQENIKLQKRAYRADSLDYAASVAAQLNFSQKAQPYFLENLGFALRK